MESSLIVNSYSNDARSHQCSTNLSVTWKPSSDFNLKADAGDSYFAVNRATHERQSSWHAGLQANYYTGDFSFSAFCKSSTKSLENYQTHTKEPWRYGISAEWNHNNLAIVLDTRYLFVNTNKTYQSLTSDCYALSQPTRSDFDNAYAPIKLLYTIGYGKRVRRSPNYIMKDSETTILR